MPYAIQRDETIDAAVRRIMHEQIVRAREQLTREDAPREKRIHDARKRFKETRALLQLVREPLGEHFAIENKWFRDAGRQLASVRDADAVVEALDKLELPHTLRTRIHKRLNRKPVNLDALIATAIRRLAIAQERVATWPQLADSFDTIGNGLRRTYREGRRALRTARTAHELHEWRKQVKTHWYHAQLLPELTSDHAAGLHTLSRLLGDHHDLHVLRESIHSAPRDVVELIAVRQNILEQQSHAIGNRVYAERPRELVARIGKIRSASR
jgi:CHAD domain-containing protein